MAVGLRDVDRFDLRGSLRSVAGDDRNNELRRADQRGKMVMMGKDATVVRDSTAGMAFGVCLGCACNSDTWKGSLRIGMEWREQVKADIPDHHEQHQHGALAPQKRRGLPQGEAIPSGPKTHSFNLSSKRLSQLDAKGISGFA